MMDMGTLWNALLTLAMGLVGWNWASMSRELQRVTILLNKTREEMAKEYVTKNGVHADITRVVGRLDAMDKKLDRFLEAQK